MVIRRCEMVWRRWIIAAVGEPVGRKAYWSANDRLGGGARKHGYRYWVTTSRSMSNFIQIGPPSVELWCYIDFQDSGRWGAILLAVSYWLTSLDLFRRSMFVSVRHIGLFLPVHTSTISWHFISYVVWNFWSYWLIFLSYARKVTVFRNTLYLWSITGDCISWAGYQNSNKYTDLSGFEKSPIVTMQVRVSDVTDIHATG